MSMDKITVTDAVKKYMGIGFYAKSVIPGWNNMLQVRREGKSCKRGRVKMNIVQGMSIKQFNDVIKDMKTIYPFEDNKAFLGNLMDLPSNADRQVEILTKDEKTGIVIHMSKEIGRDEVAYEL